MTRPVLATCVCCLASVGATAMDLGLESFGGQPLAIGAGPRALGMGGAFSAVADDATASTWNPAGLTQCERPEVALSASWYRTTVSDNAGSSTRQALRADHVSAMLPFFAAGCQQVVGMAWQRQYDFTSQQSWHVESNGPFISSAQDTSIDRSGSLASLGLSYAIEPLPGLSFGATVNRWDDRLTRASHYRMDSSSDSQDVVFGIGSTTQTRQSSQVHASAGTSVVLGTWWQATADLTLAVVAKPAYHLDLEVDATSTIRTVYNNNPATVTTISESRSAILHHPPSLTFGGAWHHADLHCVSLDTTVTRWRQYYVDNDGGRYSPININLDPDDFHDLWTVRAGYEYIAILPWAVVVPRCGAVLEYLPACTPAPAGAQEQTSATRDRWLGLTTGASVCLRRMIWDAAIQVRHGDQVGTNTYTALDHSADVTTIETKLGLTVQF